MSQRYCAQCKNESSRMTSVKCVNLRTFLRISWGIVWGIVYFKFYPRGFSFSTFDYRYFKLITIFTGKYKLLEPQKCPHNPEVVGSSPVSATIKKTGIHLECRDFSNFLTKNGVPEKTRVVSCGLSCASCVNYSNASRVIWWSIVKNTRTNHKPKSPEAIKGKPPSMKANRKTL